MFFQNLLTEPQ